MKNILIKMNSIIHGIFLFWNICRQTHQISNLEFCFWYIFFFSVAFCPPYVQIAVAYRGHIIFANRIKNVLKTISNEKKYTKQQDNQKRHSSRKKLNYLILFRERKINKYSYSFVFCSICVRIPIVHNCKYLPNVTYSFFIVARKKKKDEEIWLAVTACVSMNISYQWTCRSIPPVMAWLFILGH